MLEKKCDRCKRVIKDDDEIYTVRINNRKGGEIVSGELCDKCLEDFLNFWDRAMYQKWTDEDIKTVYSLRRQGLTETAISEETGRKKTAIHAVLYNKRYVDKAEKLLEGDE